VSIETALRDELRRVSDIRTPTDLAQRALRNVRRRRRNQILGGATAIAVIAACAVAVLVAPGKKTATVRPARQEQLVTSYLVAADLLHLQSYFLDPHTGSYRSAVTLAGVRFTRIYPSLSGHQAMVYIAGKGGPRIIDWPVKGRIRHMATLPRTVDGRTVVAWTWSPDGSRLMAAFDATEGLERATGFAIYDLRTHRSGPFVPVTLAGSQVIEWGRSSREIAISQSNPRSSLRSILFVDLAGHRTGRITVPAKGYSIGTDYSYTDAPFSPDARYISLGKGAIYDTRLRTATHPKLPGPPCKRTALVSWQGNKRFVVQCERKDAMTLYSVDITGQVKQAVPVPLGSRGMPSPPVNKLQVLNLDFGPTNGYPPKFGIRI